MERDYKAEAGNLELLNGDYLVGEVHLALLLSEVLKNLVVEIENDVDLNGVYLDVELADQEREFSNVDHALLGLFNHQEV